MRVSELKTEMDGRFRELKSEMDGRFRELKSEMDGRFKELKTEMDQRITKEGVTTRRHFDVVAEDLKSQISTLAESIQASNAEFKRRIRPVESEHVTLLSALSDHELRLRVLEGTRRDH